MGRAQWVGEERSSGPGLKRLLLARFARFWPYFFSFGPPPSLPPMFSTLIGAALVRALDEFRVEDIDEEYLSVLVPSEVLEVLLDYPSNDIMIAACRVIRDTADRSERCRRALVDAGGVEIVYEALKQRAEGDAGVFQATLGALGGLSSYGGHMADRTCVSLPLLASLHKKHPSASSTLDGLYLLAEDRGQLSQEKEEADCSLPSPPRRRNLFMKYFVGTSGGGAGGSLPTEGQQKQLLPPRLK